MPAQDSIHQPVKNALLKDGWVITADPFTIKYEEFTVFADIAADRLLALERGENKIVVEVKSFLGRSPVHDLELALGQYLLYTSLLKRVEKDRKLYLAISETIYTAEFEQKAVQAIVSDYAVALLVINVETEEEVRWIP